MRKWNSSNGAWMDMVEGALSKEFHTDDYSQKMQQSKGVMEQCHLSHARM